MDPSPAPDPDEDDGDEDLVPWLGVGLLSPSGLLNLTSQDPASRPDA